MKSYNENITIGHSKSGRKAYPKSVSGKEGFSVMLIPVVLGFLVIGPLFFNSLEFNEKQWNLMLNYVFPTIFGLLGLGLLLRSKQAYKIAYFISQLQVVLILFLLGLLIFRSGQISIMSEQAMASLYAGAKEISLLALTVLWPFATLRILNRPGVKRNFGINSWE